MVMYFDIILFIFQCTCGYLNVKTLQLGPEKKSKVFMRCLYCDESQCGYVIHSTAII